jgi:Smg protein
MFQVLVYLFETYYAADQYPDQETITRKLSQAGFKNRDIEDALKWLQGLAAQNAPAHEGALESSSGTRIYGPSELAKLGAEARGFIAFLEHTGALSPPLRELIIERAMATAHESVGVEHIKIIALMVLWTSERGLDSLVLEELLPSEDSRQFH